MFHVKQSVLLLRCTNNTFDRVGNKSIMLSGMVVRTGENGMMLRKSYGLTLGMVDPLGIGT